MEKQSLHFENTDNGEDITFKYPYCIPYSVWRPVILYCLGGLAGTRHVMLNIRLRQASSCVSSPETDMQGILWLLVSIQYLKP